jgi:hypothetical protein
VVYDVVATVLPSVDVGICCDNSLDARVEDLCNLICFIDPDNNVM